MTNKIKVENMTLTASVNDLKASKCVVKKIGFNDIELKAIESAGIDTKALDNAKKAGDKKAAADNALLFFKIDAKGVNNGAIVAIVDADKNLYVNDNCDFATMGAGGIATRLRLGALYNCFIETFTDADAIATGFNGQPIKCEKSTVDDRRAGIVAGNPDIIDW